MATPPKCKTCGIAEWRHICGVAARAIKGRQGVVSLTAIEPKVGARAKTKVTPDAGSIPGAHTKPKRDRKDYMRELMRKLRAKRVKP
jgi:hypothetical protein